MPMKVDIISEWTGEIGEVTIGATKKEGGSRCAAIVIGGGSGFPFLGGSAPGRKPLIVFEFCDDPKLWSPIVTELEGDVVNDAGDWAARVEELHRPDLLRFYLTSTRRRGFQDFSQLRRTVEEVLERSTLPLIVEGSIDPAIDSETFLCCGEAGEGERLLLGTAEEGRYRSVAAAAMAYGHSVIAQSPIDVNLAKQLNILLRETGVPHDRIVIDPYTGALGYGFEYSYSAMERIRFAALKGDEDLAMPMISAAIDSLNIKEVREADPGQRGEMAVKWELYTAVSSVIAGASVVCVRHPETIVPLRSAIDSLWGKTGGGD
jgi:acetyl-CoA decarbonylase/synthase complex subunit delta